jgi:putative transcriptional regulator
MDKHRPFASLASAVFAVALIACAPPARAADLGAEPVMLVAKPALQADQLYHSTILIVKPMGDDQHIGFIVNKPTPLTLGRLFPDHEPSQKVTEPVYLGGPVSTEVLFALVQRPERPGARSMQITPDLYAVVDRVGVDDIIEKESDHARFYAGLVLWQPGELRAEVDRGFWYVLDADSSLVLRKSTDGMWEELLERSRKNARRVRASAQDAQQYAYLY